MSHSESFLPFWVTNKYIKRVKLVLGAVCTARRSEKGTLLVHGAVFDVLRERHEDLVDVGSVLGGSLNVL